MAKAKGWRNAPNAAAGIAALAISTGDPAREPYFLGVGTTDTGRLSSGSRAGATVEFPDDYGFGEAWELRFRTADTGNGQFQGIYLQVRSDVANTSTIRGMEVEARQGAAVNLGGLTALHCAANLASTSTGNVTTAIGLNAEVQMDDTYTGTVTSLYGIRVKMQIEDGATITTGYGIYVETEAVTGAPTGSARLDAVIGVGTNPANGVGYFRYLIDAGGIELTNGSGNEVVLFKFVGANGTTYYVVHDTDAATALGVVTTDPTT